MSGDDAVRCPICNVEYKRYPPLRRHFFSVHFVDACPICGRGVEKPAFHLKLWHADVALKLGFKVDKVLRKGTELLPYTNGGYIPFPTFMRLFNKMYPPPLPRSHIYRRVWEGTIKAVKVNGHVFVPIEEVRRLEEARVGYVKNALEALEKAKPYLDEAFEWIEKRAKIKRSADLTTFETRVKKARAELEVAIRVAKMLIQGGNP